VPLTGILHEGYCLLPRPTKRADATLILHCKNNVKPSKPGSKAIGQAIVQAEYVEPETDGFSRPQLRQAMEDCKQSGATLLIARTEAIGSGA
jgi:hypothetical protein